MSSIEKESLHKSKLESLLEIDRKQPSNYLLKCQEAVNYSWKRPSQQSCREYLGYSLGIGQGVNGHPG
ncbi:hypothetical protein Tco_1076879 [Tanacetum coccineum]